MLPAHEGPLPLLPAQPLQAGAQAYERISVPFSFPPQMHRPSAPNRYTRSNTTIIIHFVAAQLNDEWDAARITSKCVGSTMTATILQTRCASRQSGSAGFPDRYRGMVRESVLGEGGVAAAITDRTTCPHCQHIPAGKCWPLAGRQPVSFAAAGWSGRREATLETMVRSSNGFLSALSA